MQVHRDLSRLPRFRNAVITIGTFDGVHIGHRKIIEQLIEEARRIEGETVIITFHPHPRKIVREGQSAVAILTTLEEKIELLEDYIDHLVVIPFDTVFASLTAEEYIQDFLYEKFHPHTIIIGYDHKFGKGREGNYQLLEKWAEKLGFVVKEISEQVMNDVIVSSTRIREALVRSDIETAKQFLGYPYSFSGTVVKGKQLGRTIGYPTANIQIEDKEKLVPGNGIYAVMIMGLKTFRTELFNTGSAKLIFKKPQWLPVTLKGMMSIGTNPTVNGTQRTIEVNIFDWSDDIYGQILRISLMKYLRAEEKFNGLDALKEQLAKDKEASLAVFNG